MTEEQFQTEVSDILADPKMTNEERIRRIRLAAHDWVDEESVDAYENGLSEGQLNAKHERESLEEEIRDDILTDFREALSLIDTNRATARTLLERATGKHIFNFGTEQTCLL